MDNIKEIGLSKLADILSTNDLIEPEPYIWEKIFNHAGLSSEYDSANGRLTTITDEFQSRLEGQTIYCHNGHAYKYLYEIFIDLYEGDDRDKRKFFCLINSIVEKIKSYKIFSKKLDGKIKKEYRYRSISYDEYLETKSASEKNKLIKEYSSKAFKKLQATLNMLELDLHYSEDGLKVKGLTNHTETTSFDDSVLVTWLNSNYPNIAERYSQALDAYGEGKPIACLVACRNIIEGIFCYKKEPQCNWTNGLKKACNKDKNISNVKVSKLLKINYNAHSEDEDERYQYPRFKLIYKLYSYTCALAGHIDAGNILETGVVDHEEVNLEDAFFGLRITEALLIWLYKSNVLED